MVSGGGPAVASSVALQVLSQRVEVLLRLAELEGAPAGQVEGSEGRVVGGARAGAVGGVRRRGPDGGGGGGGGERAGARLQHTS